jgi:aminopeptidase-like protein
MSLDFKNIDKLFDELFPILRSITGKGYIKSLNILSRYIKIKKLKYPSGKKVFDWTVPKEWVINDAYVKVDGKKIIDIKKNNLHIVNYSSPINKTMRLSQLNKHLYSIKKDPKIIPYVTSYYKKNFGFCIEHQKRQKLKNLDYQVVVDSKFVNGNIVNGISEIKGKTKKTILISTYLCHPSMANNELSGPLTLVGLYNKIKKWKNRQYNYLFLINPETIGSICFLSSHKEFLKKNLDSGLVLTCLGGPKKKLSYKKSRIGTSSLDKIFTNLSNNGRVLLREFTPLSGSDERQYCASELNLPVGQVARTVYGSNNSYHTSGDNKKFMKISQVMKSITEIEKILKINDGLYPLKRYMPYCELQLGKRGLYPNINASETRNFSSDNAVTGRKQLNILLYILSYADGKNNIVDISSKSGFGLDEVQKVLNLCIKNKLIK